MAFQSAVLSTESNAALRSTSAAYSGCFRQQTQCQDCIQCGATTGESRVVRLSMFQKQRVKSGEEDMGIGQILCLD